jgi:molecular chaperone GrpE
MFKKDHKDAKDAKVTLAQKEYEELKSKAQEKDETWAKYLRLYAEYDNSKKLWEKNKVEILKFGNFRILKEFVSVLDEIDAALLNMHDEHKDKDHTQGLKMIYKKIKDVLLREGLKPIEAKNKPFDPHLHEALFFEEKEDLEEHTVIEVIQQGYSYEDKVLRPAKVKVSLKPKETQGKDEESQVAGHTSPEEENKENIEKKEDDL